MSTSLIEAIRVPEAIRIEGATEFIRHALGQLGSREVITQTEFQDCLLDLGLILNPIAEDHPA